MNWYLPKNLYSQPKLVVTILLQAMYQWVDILPKNVYSQQKLVISNDPTTNQYKSELWYVFSHLYRHLLSEKQSGILFRMEK